MLCRRSAPWAEGGGACCTAPCRTWGRSGCRSRRPAATTAATTVQPLIVQGAVLPTPAGHRGWKRGPPSRKELRTADLHLKARGAAASLEPGRRFGWGLLRRPGADGASPPAGPAGAGVRRGRPSGPPYARRDPASPATWSSSSARRRRIPNLGTRREFHESSECGGPGGVGPCRRFLDRPFLSGSRFADVPGFAPAEEWRLVTAHRNRRLSKTPQDRSW